MIRYTSNALIKIRDFYTTSPIASLTTQLSKLTNEIERSYIDTKRGVVGSVAINQ